MSQTWSMDEAKEWRRLYEYGATARQVAETFRVTYGVARRGLQAVGTQLRSPGPRPNPAGRKPRSKTPNWKFDQQTIARICRDYESGMTTREVGKKYGPSHPAISRILRRASVTLRWRRSRQLTEDESRLVCAKNKHGYSVRILAEEFGCSQNVIRTALEAAKEPQ